MQSPIPPYRQPCPCGKGGPLPSATSGWMGDLVPGRPDISELPTALLVVGGIVVAGFLLSVMFTGAPEKPREDWERTPAW